MSDLLSWFPFYVGRFLNSRRARRMAAEQVGVYLLLLCEQWENGPIPDDDAELSFIGRADASVVRDVLLACFDRTDDGWVNTRLEEVRVEQATKFAQRSAAGTKAAEARWSGRNANAMRSDANRGDKKRLEKKREETTRAARKRALPADWVPNEQHRAIATVRGVSCDDEAAKMRDWATAEGARKLDWDATFRNWLKRATPPAKAGWRGPNPEAEREHLRQIAQRHDGLKPVITERPTTRPPTNSEAVKPGNISISLPDGPSGGAAA